VSASALPGDFWETLPLRADVRLLAKDANGLAAFDKPAGVLSHPNDAPDEPRSLLTCHYDKAAQCFHWTAPDGGRRQLWLLNRLDSATSGVILTAASAPLATVISEHFGATCLRSTKRAGSSGPPPWATSRPRRSSR